MGQFSDLAKQGITYQPLGDTAQKPDDTGDFMRGVKKSVYQIPQTVGGTLALAGDAMGADGLRDYGMQIYQNNEDKINAITKPSDSLTAVMNGEPGADAGSFLKNAAGYVAGQAATALLTGGVGGIIGKQLALRGIGEVAAQAAAKRIAEKELEGQAAEILARRAGGQFASQAASNGLKYGAGSALGASNYIQEAGSIYPDAVAQAKADGRTLDGGDLARVAGSAALAAGVDTAMEGTMAHKLLAGGRREGESAVRAALREVPGMAGKEAATEGIQTGIERYGAQQDMTSADAVRDYVDSMGVGAIGGGMGGGVSVVHGAHAPAAQAAPVQPVPESGPLSRAANAGIDAQQQAIAADPNPVATLGDGSTVHKADLANYLNQFATPEQRTAAQNKLMGLDENGKPLEQAPAEPPKFADTPEQEQAALKAWGAEHKPATLKQALALKDAPGAPDGLMVAPHPDGKGYTLVPSNWLTLDSQANYADLQKPAPTKARPKKEGTDEAAPANDGAAGTGGGRTAAGPGADDAAAAGPAGPAPVPQAAAAPASGEPAADAAVRAAGGADAAPALEPEWKTNPYTAYKYADRAGAEKFFANKKIDPEQFHVTQDDKGRWVVKAKPAEQAQAAPSPDEVASAAHEAATSPQNDLPEPTQAQKEAGNYKLGHVQLHGLDVSIENPAGSVRRGVSPDGKPWENTLAHHYGYIKKTLGADGDHVDAFIGPNPASERAFVVDQVDPKTGKFDEHKILLGFDSREQAEAGYKANYETGWKGGKAIRETSIAGLKTWLNEGDTTRPFSSPAKIAPVMAESVVPATLRDTRGGADRFHGTSRALPYGQPNNEYAMSGDSRNIYGQGFYTTDAADIARGYMKKGKGSEPNLYHVTEHDGVKLYDMEQPLTPEVRKMAERAMGDAFPAEDIDGKPIHTLRGLFDEYRAESQNNGLTRDDVQETFDAIRYNLEQDGYRGYRHIGGENTGKKSHDVRIYWTPENDIKVRPDDIARYHAKATKDEHADEAFASEAEARAYLSQNKIEETHRIHPTGHHRFEIIPIPETERGVKKLAAGRAKHEMQDEVVRKAAENNARRKAEKEAAQAAAQAQPEPAQSAEPKPVPAGNAPAPIQEAPAPARTDKIGDQHKAREAAKAQADAPPADYHGFGDKLAPMLRARMEKTLSTQMRFDGRFATRKEEVERRVAAGARVESNAKDGRRLVNAEGGGFLAERDITKAAMDYAQHLIAQRAETATQAAAENAPEAAKPFDHGELNIPGRTNGIDAELDKHKAQQAKEEKTTTKAKALQTREAKMRAKELFSEHGEAMLDKYGPKFDRKKLAAEFDSMVKWEPAKFITLAEKFAQEQQDSNKEPEQPASLETHERILDAARDGTLSLDELRSAYQRTLDGEQALKEQMAGKKKDDLLRAGGAMFAYRHKADTKPEIIKALYNDMLEEYTLGTTGGISYMLGGGSGTYEQAKRAAIAKAMDAMTTEKMAGFAAKVSDVRAERDAQREQQKQAIADPKTLDDYTTLIRSKQADGMTFTEARLSLEPEQRAKLDELLAEKSRGERARRKVEQQEQEMRAPGEPLTATETIQTRHTKHGHDLWQFNLEQRVSNDEFKDLVAKARRLGGDYSSYRGNGAVPGWQFRTPEAAAAFKALIAGDASAAKDVLQARRDAFADDKSQSAAERLNEMAATLEGWADESDGTERKTNTARRAGFAAAAEKHAAGQRALAETMRNIAAAIESGKAKFLDRVRQKVQVTLLGQLALNARSAAADHEFPITKEGNRWARPHGYEKRLQQPVTVADMDHAEWPSFTAFRSDLASLGRRLLEVDGTKKMGQQILKVADDVTDTYLKFAKENLPKVGTFATKDGQRAVFSSKDDAERAIARSGYRGKAIVLPVKRGENVIVMSPSEAMARGIWEGDGDKKITLSSEFGSELVEKLGKINRRSNRVDLPWSFETAHQRLAVLARMGIETPAELRAALREFMALKVAPKEADKVKQLERAMVGRKNDGLDFFPTPEAQADEMVAAADLQPGMDVLEPSAGMGHIADRIRAAGIEPDVVEMSDARRELLEAKGYDLVGRDFMDLDQGKKYNRIIMNPPFSDRRDAQHVQHAYNLLKPGGRLVAIMGEGVFFGKDKSAQAFRDWIEAHGGTSEKLAEGTFMDPSLPVNTGVNARMIVVDKPGSDTQQAEQQAEQQPDTLHANTSRTIEVDGVRRPITNAKGQLVAGDFQGQKAFWRWFGDSKAVDEQGRPMVVYHGTDAAEHFDEFAPGSFFTTDPREGSAYAFPRDFAVRQRSTGKYTVATGSQFADQMMPYYGSVSEIPRPEEGQVYATDNGVFRFEGQGKWSVFSDLVVDYDHGDADRLRVVKGDATTEAQTLVDEYEQYVREVAPRGDGGRVLPAYLSLKNPVRLWALEANKLGIRLGATKESIAAAIAKYESQGYDGIITESDDVYMNSELARELGSIPTQYIIFHPEQVKSATGNAGTFSPEHADITAKAGQSASSPMDASVADMVREGTTAGKVLAHIAENSDNANFRALATALQAQNLKTGILYGAPTAGTYSAGVTAATATASYNQATDTARLHQVDGAEQNALHELVHAATLKALQKGGLAATQIKALWAHVKAIPDMVGEYGSTSPEEFVAEAFTNPHFAQLLSDIPVPGTPKLTFWQKLVGIVRILLGKPMVDDNVLARVMQAGPGLMEENREPSPAQSSRGLAASTNPKKVALGEYRVKVKDGEISVTVEPGNYDGQYYLSANRNGEVIASMHIGTDRHDENEYSVSSVAVDANEQRKGVASAMYDTAHKAGIRPIVRDVRQSAEARAVWKNQKSEWKPKQTSALVSDQRASFASQRPDELRASINTALGGAVDRIENVRLPAHYLVGDLFNQTGKISWWHKTVGTMDNLARRHPVFAPVYDSVQNFIGDVSRHAVAAADQAPTLLPKLDSIRDVIGKDRKQAVSAADTKAIAGPIFEGTLSWARDEHGRPVKVADLEQQAKNLTTAQKAQVLLQQGVIDDQQNQAWMGNPLDFYDGLIAKKYAESQLKAGVVWSDAELRSMFHLDDGQIALYREFRKATDASLTRLSVSEMVKLGGKEAKPLFEQAINAGSLDKAALLLRDHFVQLARENPEAADMHNDTATQIMNAADKAQDLIDRGYAPLSRFGKYTVYVEENGEQVYFGMFEGKAEAARMARQMRLENPGAQVLHGTVSEEAYKLFAGISPETIELFGSMVGLGEDTDPAAQEVYQAYLKLAKNNRSAMKRLIHRKGIAGFSEDAARVLASFIYSNARLTSSNQHGGEIDEAVKAIPKQQGELTDAAMQLREQIKNPENGGTNLGGLMFAQFLGGSVASALVNMTQPVAMTLPFLSQYGGIGKATTRLGAAYRDAAKKSTGDAQLDAALKWAEAEGIVAPQEIHYLQALAQGKGALRAGDGSMQGNARAALNNTMSKVQLGWGNLFALAEQANRRVTFIAAYRTAVEEGKPNPAKFAEDAVSQTQGVYNSGNRPRWARGPVGNLLMTFKQYSISYLELMSRMAFAGEPGSPERAAGQRAALYMVGVLFLLGGADGLPFEKNLEDAIDGILQRLGYNFSTKRAKQAFLTDALGKGGADFALKGLSAMPGMPIDVAGRFGMGNLIPGTGLLTKKEDYTRDLGELAGPAGDLAKRAFTGAGKALGGDLGGAALDMAPQAVRNIAKGVDMLNTGSYNDARGYKVNDTTPTEAVLKMVGFQPNSTANVQDAKGQALNMLEQNRMRSKEIAEHWAQGLAAKDPAMIQQARDMLHDWNEKNPETPIKAGMPGILKRVKAMKEDAQARTEKTAPKALKQTVRRELAETRD